MNNSNPCIHHMKWKGDCIWCWIESYRVLETELQAARGEIERLKNKQEEYLDKFNELSLQAVRYRDENERLERCRLITDKSWQELTEENTRLKARVEELEENTSFWECEKCSHIGSSECEEWCWKCGKGRMVYRPRKQVGE